MLAGDHAPWSQHFSGRPVVDCGHVGGQPLMFFASRHHRPQGLSPA